MEQVSEDENPMADQSTQMEGHNGFEAQLSLLRRNLWLSLLQSLIETSR
ncbi:hypothetical protein glysoja_010862 [Glycine soja]|nr:hypothetical protein glysoja_010862 [Glycine soja]